MLFSYFFRTSILDGAPPVTIGFSIVLKFKVSYYVADGYSPLYKGYPFKTLAVYDIKFDVNNYALFFCFSNVSYYPGPGLST